ncbi:MAG: hypothetical protein ACRDDZ_07935 [Marinifilaceae bacterium]
MKTSTLLARIFSVVFHPLFMPIIMIIVVFCVPSVFSAVPKTIKWLTTCVSVAFMTIVPALGMLSLKKLNLISNYELTVRTERVYPLLITILSVGVGFLILRGVEQIPVVLRLYLVLIVLLSVFSLITMWWKISMHMLGIGGLCGFLFYMGARVGVDVRWELMLAFIAAGMLGFARLKLKRHTPMQVLCGFLLGFGAVAGLMW